MKKALPFVALMATGLVCFVACDKKKGKSFGAPAIEPPVAEATPGALRVTTTSLSLTEVTESTRCDDGDTDCFRERALVRLVKRVFSGREGCNDSAGEELQGKVRCNLHKIDSRLAELDKRAKDSARKCVDESTKDHAIVMSTGVGRTAKLQCGENLRGDEGLRVSLGFGFDNDVFHVLEVQDEGPTYYATVNQETGDIEFLMASHKSISSAIQTDTSEQTPGNEANNGKYALDLMHIKANKNDKSFEFSVGANYMMGVGVGCGVRLKSDGTYIYAKGTLAEPTVNTLETDCATSDSNVAQSVLDICLDAVSLDPVSSGSCAGLTTFTVTDITPAKFAQGDLDTVRDHSFLDKVTGFNVDAK